MGSRDNNKKRYFFPGAGERGRGFTRSEAMVIGRERLEIQRSFDLGLLVVLTVLGLLAINLLVP